MVLRNFLALFQKNSSKKFVVGNRKKRQTNHNRNKFNSCKNKLLLLIDYCFCPCNTGYHVSNHAVPGSGIRIDYQYNALWEPDRTTILPIRLYWMGHSHPGIMVALIPRLWGTIFLPSVILVFPSGLITNDVELYYCGKPTPLQHMILSECF